MIAQVQSSTLFTVTKTVYQKERRAQIIACDCLKDLNTLYKLLKGSIDKLKYGLYCPILARDDPSIRFCYIPVKVRKLLDMGFLIKMILSASTRFFKSENPTVEDLVKYVKLATPPKSNLEKVRLMYRHNLKGNSTNLCPAHPEHRRNSTRRCTEQFSSSPNRPPTRGLFGHWYQTEKGTGDCL